MFARAAGTAAVIASIGVGMAWAEGPEPGEARTVTADEKAVLVELFTSQGCNYCPTAERVVAEFEAADRGRNQFVPLAFHVDYFNTPWADPFSSKAYSGRQWAYHEAAKARDKDSPDLYFTPLVMVDGRYPMSGYHKDGTAPVRPFLTQRLEHALAARPSATLTLTLAPAESTPDGRSLTVTAALKDPRLDGETRLVGVAITEGPLTTAVPSGENAGVSLVEHNVVRRFQAKPLTLDRRDPAKATFELALEDGWDPAQCEVVAFLQDEATGAVEQAAVIAWQEQPESVAEVTGR